MASGYLFTFFLASLWVFASTAYAKQQCTLNKPLSLALTNCTIKHRDSPDVESWGIPVSIGSPRQELCLVPSTVVSNTLLMGSELCAGDNLNGSTPEQCASRRGGLFDTGAAGSSFARLPVDKANLASDPVWTELMKPLPPYTIAGTADLDLQSDLKLQGLSMAIITDGQDHNAGHLGLGENSTLLEELLSQGIIHKRGFGLNAGSQSYKNPRLGSLVLGGYDRANVIGAFREYPINRYSSDRYCPLQLDVKRIVLRRPGVGDVDVSGRGSTVPACIEPYDNLFRMPSDVLDEFTNYTNWNQDTVAPSDLYVVEPGLLYPSDVGFEGSLIFSLEGGLEVEVPNEEMQHPLRGLDANGQRQLRNDTTEVSIFAERVLFHKAVLGKAFLSQVYLAVDYDRGIFMLAPLFPDAVGSDLVPFSQDPLLCHFNKLEGLLIGLMIVACIVAILLLFLVAIYFKKLREERVARQAANGAVNGDEEITPVAVYELREDGRDRNLWGYRYQLDAGNTG